MKFSSAFPRGKRKVGTPKALSSLRPMRSSKPTGTKGRAKSAIFGKPRMKGPKPTRIY